MTNPRASEMWDHLRGILTTARMLSILQGGRVYIESIDNFAKADGPADKMWGRLVLVPTGRVWDDTVGTGIFRAVSFLTRAEANPNYAAGSRVDKLLEGIHDEAYNMLNGHIVPKMTFVMGATALWQSRPPQMLPLWDNDRGLYFTSAEWRLEIAAP